MRLRWFLFAPQGWLHVAEAKYSMDQQWDLQLVSLLQILCDHLYRNRSTSFLHSRHFEPVCIQITQCAYIEGLRLWCSC